MGRLLRYLYSFLLYLALPYIFLRIYWRSRRLPAYRERVLERVGFYPFSLEKCIWVHAVSVGEALAAVPLLKALKTRYPTWPLLVTTMTPTGAARVIAAMGDNIKHVYLPYDTLDGVARFLQTMKPAIAIIMETELWPNLLAACYARHIPLCLLNARLSAKSAAGYQKIAPLTATMLQHLSVIAAHGEVDAKRFIALGAPSDRVIVTGNIKFDLELPADLSAKSAALRVALGAENRFIWIAASTHDIEEEKMLAVHKQLLATQPTALLILVPRHPDRFNTVAALCEQSGMKTVRRSSQHPQQQSAEIYLGDTMGELLLLYAVADVAFVGGSLIERGGHNMLEPGALGKPILTGPHVFNFAEISELFVTANALIKVADEKILLQQLQEWIAHPDARAATGARAKQVVDANRGALKKQLDVIKSLFS